MRIAFEGVSVPSALRVDFVLKQKRFTTETQAIAQFFVETGALPRYVTACYCSSEIQREAAREFSIPAVLIKG